MRKKNQVLPVHGGAVRIGNAEREQVMDALGRYHTRGFLTYAEYDHRLSQASETRTQWGLLQLVRDLPGAAARPEERERDALVVTGRVCRHFAGGYCVDPKDGSTKCVAITSDMILTIESEVS